MAYDAAQHLLVLFGGILSTLPGQSTNETWVWNGRGWQQMHPSASPPALDGDGIMAYDAASQQIILVLYQILSGGKVDNQMWTWDGTTWQQPHPATMPEVIGASMVYDAARHQIVLYGGEIPYGHVGMVVNTTWTWDGTTWSQRTPATVPSPRADAALVYDSARQQVVLYSGARYGPPLNDLWTWNGNTWQQQHPAQMPPERVHGTLIYDEALQQAILFAGDSFYGLQPLGDTWAWNGTGWTEISAEGAPVTPIASAAYDPDQQAIVVYAAPGNLKASPPVTPVSQTWIWNGTGWTLWG
jgi:hypothetical protein